MAHDCDQMQTKRKIDKSIETEYDFSLRLVQCDQSIAAFNQRPVVQRWVSVNPGLKFNLLF